MKTVVKNILCSLLFASLIIGSLVFGSTLVEPKGNSKEDGMKDYSAVGIISEPANTIDAVFIGDTNVDINTGKLRGFEALIRWTMSAQLRHSVCIIRLNCLKKL